MSDRYNDALIAEREPLWRAALERCLTDHAVEKDLKAGYGCWVDEMAPLTPAERTLVLREVKRWYGVEDKPNG